MLAGAAFISRANLQIFWSEKFKPGRNLVEEVWNCEDLLMNAVAVQPPIFICPDEEYQIIGMPGAVSLKRGHLTQRSECLNSFRDWFGDAWLRREGSRGGSNTSGCHTTAVPPVRVHHDVKQKLRPKTGPKKERQRQPKGGKKSKKTS